MTKLSLICKMGGASHKVSFTPTILQLKGENLTNRHTKKGNEKLNFSNKRNFLNPSSWFFLTALLAKVVIALHCLTVKDAAMDFHVICY